MERGIRKFMKEGSSDKNRTRSNFTGNSPARKLYFYLLSLFLSIILILVSTAVLITVVYLTGHIAPFTLYLLIAIVASNIAIGAVCIRGVLITYSALPISSGNQHILAVPSKNNALGEKIPGKEKLTSEFFSEPELKVIDLLIKNNHSMLQNAIVQNMNMSKTSVSRVIASLESKGIIVKVRSGVTNKIIMPETYFK